MCVHSQQAHDSDKGVAGVISLASAFRSSSPNTTAALMPPSSAASISPAAAPAVAVAPAAATPLPAPLGVVNASGSAVNTSSIGGASASIEGAPSSPSLPSQANATVRPTEPCTSSSYPCRVCVNVQVVCCRSNTSHARHALTRFFQSPFLIAPGYICICFVVNIGMPGDLASVHASLKQATRCFSWHPVCGIMLCYTFARQHQGPS